MALEVEGLAGIPIQVSLPNVYEAFLGALEKVHLHPHDVIAEIVGMRNDVTLLRILCGPNYEQCLESSIATSKLVALDTSVLGQLEQLALACREATVNGYKTMMKTMQP